MDNKLKQLNKINRHRRIRSKISGTKEKPRVSVFKSRNGLNVQFVDDKSHVTILSGNTLDLNKGNKTEKASLLGEKLSADAQKAGINEVVFDKGSSKYHGRVKALAEGLRKGGLKF